MYKPLGDEQLQNVIDFYLDHRDFMTANEMMVFEKVINTKKVNPQEAYILTRLQNELKNLK